MKRRRGIIFITALGIIVVLTGLALVFAQSMRTEALASANRRSQAQADSIELGAEQWVLAQIDEYPTDAYTLTTQVQTDTIPVGTDEITGYFWILPTDLTEVNGPVCGITDESSKLNINMSSKTTLINSLQNLCDSLNITLPDDTPYSIYNWSHYPPDTNGAADTDYAAMAEPYQIKTETTIASPFESVEELLLVGQQPDILQGVMPQLLWGTDTGRNTLRFEWQQNSGGTPGGITSGTSNTATTGIFNYLTVYSFAPAAAANVNRQINPFTASQLVLEALGLTQAQAESIVEAREANASSSGSAGSSGYSWALTAAGLPNTGGVANYFTGVSYRYSADIVAVSADGRAFKRVRIVVDVSQSNPLAATLGTTTPPAVIVYRKDLTAYGWPLPGTQKNFQDQAARGQLPTGWLGTALMSPGTAGQSH